MSAMLFRLLTLSLIGVPGAQGLIALWAATGRRHWFLRALAVWGGIVLLIPIRAYEPAVILAIESLVIMCLVHTGRELVTLRATKRSNASVQFSLRDLLLFMLLVGLFVVTFQAINRGYTLQEWLSFAVTGSLVAAVVCVAARLAVGPQRWLWRLLLATVVAIAVPLVGFTTRGSRAEALWEVFDALYNPPFSLPSMLPIGLAFVELAGFILIGVSLVYFRWAGRSNWLQVARRAALTLAAVECVWLAWLYCQMLFLTPFPPPFAGGTNHYRRIAEISQLLGGNHGRGPAAGVDAAALADEARQLLAAPNYVESDPPSRALRDLQAYIAAASAMREICRVFDADSKAAVLQDEFDRAAELGVANLRLGSMLNRGGTIIDGLIGLSCQGAGMANIVPVRASLSPVSMRNTIEALRQARTETDSVEIIAQRDAAIEERAGGWQPRLTSVFLKSARAKTAGEEAFAFARLRFAARIVLLEADLAIRLYEHDHGELPKLLSDLVPDYLPEVPRDPFAASGDFIRYRIDGDAFLLYSVGMDGHDDGGALAPTNRAYWQSGKNARYDYDLETDTR